MKKTALFGTPHAAAVLAVAVGLALAAPAYAAKARPARPAAKTEAQPEPARAVLQQPPAEDFTNMELEQLMSMEVTGVTRRAGSYATSPAAVFVLTGEDIRRSGARTIAQALRLVPGLQVYRSNAQNYTVTARGFGADKLQVLLDGRSVYTPLTSTTSWDVLDTYMEDIARIEVIRGPGATVWGANAVNGVINIITKRAADTTGTQAYAGGGNEELAFGGFRSGGRVGDSSNGRAYVTAKERDASLHTDGSEYPDGQSLVQAGGRIDTDLGKWGAVTFTGDLYQAREYGATFPSGSTADTSAGGRNLGAQWTYDWGGGAATQTSLYYDGYDRVIPTIYAESRDTYDLSVQHNMAALADHLLTFGAGVRVTSDETGGPPNVIVFDPANRTLSTYSGFMQDEWALTDSLWLIAGTKLEHSSFSNFDFEPGVRLGWSINQQLFTWGSVSRAVRTPNRLDHDTAVVCSGAGAPVPDCTANGQILPVGNGGFRSEKLIAYEWGLRTQLTPDLLTDLSLFFNNYTDLRSVEPGLKIANNIRAHGYGGELSTSWQPARWMSLQAFYSYLKIAASKDESSGDAATVNSLEGGSPQQQAGLRLGWQPWTFLAVDSFARYVDSLPAQKIPAYAEMDLRLAWHATPLLELALVGQNLLDAAHPETGASAASRAEIQRSVFGEVTWRWK